MFNWLFRFIDYLRKWIGATPLGLRCVLRLGLPGSGKTLDQTETDVLPHLLSGVLVKSCYWLNWDLDNLVFFSKFEDIENDRNCVHVFDEVGQIFPAREFASEGLRVQIYFQLHRHRHIEIIANTQDVSLVAKTVGIVASDWVFCSRTNNLFFDLLRKLFSLSSKVDVFTAHLTWQQLKKMATTWELEQILELDPEINTNHKHYPTSKILHPELDCYKIEIVHKYCPKCAMRQGSQILKENTMDECFYDKKKKYYGLRTREFCPLHFDTFLEVRFSGMYDTDYEPQSIDEDVKLVPMKKVLVESWVKHTGVLPDRLIRSM